jgi:L-aminopeptidase/D-esterase-like protein
MSQFRIGHWTDSDAKTGCTVVLFSNLVPAVVDIRGGSPATRETDLLSHDKLVGKVDAILLTGGSAFGLGAADGVMRYLREQGRGWPTRVLPVPIVAAAALYDLGTGEPVWPDGDAGYSACLAAVEHVDVGVGAVGVGTGATFRKVWTGLPPLQGGIGIANVSAGDAGKVYAVVAVNAIGDVMSSPTHVDGRSDLVQPGPRPVAERESTTLGVVIVDVPCSRRTLSRVAVSAHDSIARSIVPAHTLFDGDAVFAAGLQESAQSDASLDLMIAVAAELAMEQAIAVAVRGS